MSRGSDMLSIIISTRNRAAVLRDCLDALARDAADDISYEAMVVDNASTDDTQEVLHIEMERGRLPLQGVVEEQPGLSRARNAGVKRAAGEGIIFLDDDALVRPGFLAAYAGAFASGADLVQGRILAKFMEARPAWIDAELLPRLTHVDLGDGPVPYSGNLTGANFGVRVEVFDRIGGFRKDLGAGVSGFGEDTDFGLRARAAGFDILYAPGAAVDHLVAPERATVGGILRRFYECGLSRPLFQRYDESTARMLLHFARMSVGHGLQALCTLSKARRIRALGNMAEHFGRVRRIVRQRRHG